ncbi:seryl-tRNA synthetase [Basidiobolus meristosporus CBS 931.73]|uniref:serine--tRNA ligase n=1 Tax=Basidiobolus meristosporus CBS 931.73 TaxID=1314790 RepID=A0A1Y1YM04_9FUNG|nr:seryl-tRNA synthetase [Basidiobolus meristosporus CBS 931.73]|eukprot:ORX99049.1 seryl-tRNA synthetase [Basidiobolus meristosporus CBS 931.73]
MFRLQRKSPTALPAIARRWFGNTTPARALPKPSLNFKHFRDNLEHIEKNIVSRNLRSVNVRQVVNLYDKFCDLTQEINHLRSQRNDKVKEIGKLGKEAKTKAGQVLLEAAKVIKEALKEKETSFEELEKQLYKLALSIPNDTHPEAPVGEEKNAKVVKVVGEPRKEDWKLKDHVELARSLDLIDLEAAAEVTGSSWYYLKNAGALLEIGLIQYAMAKAMSKGFTPVITPDVVKLDVAHCCGYQPRDNEATQIYSLNSDETADSTHQLCLTGTAEIPLAGLMSNKIIPEEKLPVKLVGFGRAFRAEAGARGADTKGLYRVHQFSKVELFTFAKPEDSNRMLEEIRALEEEIFTDLGLCFRILDMPTEELGASAYRKYDMEAWMPGRNGWGEISSTSNCTDYQSRRLNIRYRSEASSNSKSKKPNALEFVHTLNGTACAIPRMIISILEQYQTEEGHVVVPKVLRPFLGGLEVIKPQGA